MTHLLPFGTPRPMHGELRERVAGLGAHAGQVRVLNELPQLMEEREFVEGRAARVTYEAELVRCAGLRIALPDILAHLKTEGSLISLPAAAMFDDGHPRVVLRIRRSGVVLPVEAARHPWLEDSSVRSRAGGLS